MKDVMSLISEKDLQWTFIQSTGPGGQNVNKVATGVQLRLNVGITSSLPEEVRIRLIRLAGRRVTTDGILLLESKRYRTQKQNRQNVLQRLVDMLGIASEKPKTRRKTHPTLSSHQKRLAKKRQRSGVKRLRGEQFQHDEF